MIHAAPRRIELGIGLATVALVAGLVVVMIQFGRGYYDGGYEISAIFPSSSQGLFTDGGSDVKVRGLNVGTVSGIELLDDGRARVTLRLDEGVLLPDTAAASIEPLSVFGPKFIRIDPGAHEASGPYLDPGDTIVDTRTTADLTETLDTAAHLLEGIDPAELASIFEAVTESVDGLGPAIGRTIDSSAALAGVAADHVADLEQFLVDLATLSGTFGAHAEEIVATVDGLSQLVPALTADPEQFGELLDVTTGIATTFAGLLEDNRADLDATFIALAAFVGGVYQESEDIPEVLALIGTFFGRLSDVIRMPAAGGRQMAALRGFIGLDACLVFGICPEGGTA